MAPAGGIRAPLGTCSSFLFFWFTKSADPIFTKTGIKIKLLVNFFFFFSADPGVLVVQKLKKMIYFLHFFLKKISSKCGICIIAFIMCWFTDVRTHLTLIVLFYHINRSLEHTYDKNLNHGKFAKVQSQWTVKYNRSWGHDLYIPAGFIEIHTHMEYQLATINRVLRFYIGQNS